LRILLEPKSAVTTSPLPAQSHLCAETSPETIQTWPAQTQEERPIQVHFNAFGEHCNEVRGFDPFFELLKASSLKKWPKPLPKPRYISLRRDAPLPGQTPMVDSLQRETLRPMRVDCFELSQRIPNSTQSVSAAIARPCICSRHSPTNKSSSSKFVCAKLRLLMEIKDGRRYIN
jgi:hypothetical protein